MLHICFTSFRNLRSASISNRGSLEHAGSMQTKRTTVPVQYDAQLALCIEIMEAAVNFDTRAVGTNLARPLLRLPYSILDAFQIDKTHPLLYHSNSIEARGRGKSGVVELL